VNATNSHKPQRNTVERATALHIRRNRQNLRDAKRGLLWQQWLQFAITDSDAGPAMTPGEAARRFARIGFVAVPKTGWRARAKAEAAKAAA
jgi:hypothetical protein